MINFKKKNQSTTPTINPYAKLKPFIVKDKYKKLKPIIEVKDLTQYFKTRKTTKVIYENINFEIFENERLAFLGPNGAGKSITVSTLCGIHKNKGGEIIYNFKFEHTPYEKISVQFQDLQFPNSLTANDLIRFSLRLANVEYDEEELSCAMNIFEIDKIKHIKMSKLSGGQQQRVNVFISMLSKPKVLFLDEFTTGLDIAIKNKIQKYIQQYCKENKISLVIISHDIDIINELAERIIILADGKIMVDAFKKDIVKKFGSVSTMLKKYIVA